MNGWLRDFFKKNAYTILVFIITAIIYSTIFYMSAKGTEDMVHAIAPKVMELEKKQSVQENINCQMEKKLDRIDDKLDRLLRR